MGKTKKELARDLEACQKQIQELQGQPTASEGTRPEKGLSLWRSLFGWETLFRWEVLSAIVPGVFIAIGLGMLGVDWFPHHLLISQICFAMAAVLIITKTIGHAWVSKERLLSKIVFCSVLCGATLFGEICVAMAIQAHAKFRPSISLSAFVSIGHQKGANVGGITWGDERFQDIRLLVGNMSQYSVQNIDLTVRVLDNSEDVFVGMGQLSDIPGVQFNGPKAPDMIVQTDHTNISSRDTWAMSSSPFPWGYSWNVFCPRLPREGELRLVVAAIHKQDFAPPKNLRVVGSFEVVSSEGIKVVSVDKTLSVER